MIKEIEMINKRQEYNYKILNILKFDPGVNQILISYDRLHWFFETLTDKIYKHPGLRFGQIYYNYLFDEIENDEEVYEDWVYNLTDLIFEDRFTIFNEESNITLKNLK